METVRIFMPVFVIMSSTMFKVMAKVLMPVLFNLMGWSLVRKKGLNIMMFNSMLGLMLNIVEQFVVLVLDILHQFLTMVELNVMFILMMIFVTKVVQV